MNPMTPITSTARADAAPSALIATGRATPKDVAGTSRVLRIPPTVGGYFGLLSAVYKFKNSGWASPSPRWRHCCRPA